MDVNLRVLVTGGAGFIGSHTVELLLSWGCRVVVLDNFRTGKRTNLSHLMGNSLLRVIETDVSDGVWSSLHRVEQEWGGIDAIIHLAAQTSVVYSMQNPLDDMRNNYVSTAHLLEYAKTKGVQRVVFASSAATYGEVSASRVDETFPTRPVSPYGIHKLASEALLRCYAQTGSLSATSLRFFNVYGPRQDPKSPYAGVISVFLDRVLAGQPLTLFGSGEQTRDFIYVKDVARAIGLACLQEHGAGDAFNIATGKTVTVRELARHIFKLCDAQENFVYMPERSGEIRHSCADVTKAAEVLKFMAETPLDMGLRSTIEAMKAGRGVA